MAFGKFSGEWYRARAGQFAFMMTTRVEEDNTVDEYRGRRVSNDEIPMLVESFGKLSIGGTIERYEDNLSLLMQEFVTKCQYRRKVEGKWPPAIVEDTALLLSERLDGLEWRSVQYRPGYLKELDEVWFWNKKHFATDEKQFQIIWEYVAGIIRIWDGFGTPRKGKEDKWTTTRYKDCCKPVSRSSDGQKPSIYLPRCPSLQRRQLFFEKDEYKRYTREVRTSDLRGSVKPKHSVISCWDLRTSYY